MALADSELVKSSDEYLKAASYYPADDEKHICQPIQFPHIPVRRLTHHSGYLHIAFGALFDVGAPVRDLLEILDKVHDALPRTKAIWEFGVASQSEVRAAFEADMQCREELLRAAEGKSEDELSRMTIRRETVKALQE